MQRWPARMRSALPLLALLAAAGCADMTAAPTERATAPQAEAKAKLEPAVAAALRRMSDTLAAAPAFGVRVASIREASLPGGQQVLLHGTTALAMRRPDRLVAVSGSQAGNFRLTYDGRRAALLDVDHNEFGANDFSGPVDGLLQALERHFGVSIPMADLLAANPYAALVDEGTTGVYVGPTVIDGVICRHYALRTGEVDWEIWIEAGPKALPRLLSTVDRTEAGRSRTILAFSDWTLSPRLDAPVFDTTPPRGARLLTADEAAQRGAKP